MAPDTKDIDLSKIWLFSTCSSRQLRTIRKALEEVTRARRQGPGARRAPSGGSSSSSSTGRPRSAATAASLATLGPGQYFGELALLDRRPRSATVISDTEMLLLVLGQRQFNGVLDAMPALARKLLAAMSTRFREADARVASVNSH